MGKKEGFDAPHIKRYQSTHKNAVLKDQFGLILMSEEVVSRPYREIGMSLEAFRMLMARLGVSCVQIQDLYFYNPVSISLAITRLTATLRPEGGRCYYAPGSALARQSRSARKRYHFKVLPIADAHEDLLSTEDSLSAEHAVGLLLLQKALKSKSLDSMLSKTAQDAVKAAREYLINESTGPQSERTALSLLAASTLQAAVDSGQLPHYFGVRSEPLQPSQSPESDREGQEDGARGEEGRSDV